MRRHHFHIIQLVLTAVILAYVFRDADMRQRMLSVLRHANTGWLLLGVLIAGLGELANIWRWGIFLRVQNVTTGWLRISGVFMIGVFFNMFPWGIAGGDAVKAIYLVKDNAQKKAEVILTLIADRLIGLLSLLLFAVPLVIWRYEWLTKTRIAADLLYFLLVFLGASCLVLAVSFVITGFGWMNRLPQRMPGRKKLLEVCEAYNLFAKAWRESLLAFVLSFPIMFAFFLTFWCAARSFHAHVSLADIFAIMPVVTVITSFPLTFSGLGVREQLFERLLGDLAGVSADIAVLISLTGFMINLVWSFVGAGCYLMMAFQKNRRALEKTGTASQPDALEVV
jgi:hypothetical protein